MVCSFISFAKALDVLTVNNHYSQRILSPLVVRSRRTERRTESNLVCSFSPVQILKSVREQVYEQEEDANSAEDHNKSYPDDDQVSDEGFAERGR